MQDCQNICPETLTQPEPESESVWSVKDALTLNSPKPVAAFQWSHQRSTISGLLVTFELVLKGSFREGNTLLSTERNILD